MRRVAQRAAEVVAEAERAHPAGRSRLASPPLDPPAVTSGFHGLRVSPCSDESVCTRSPRSGRFVRADRDRAGGPHPLDDGRVDRRRRRRRGRRRRCVVGVPATSMFSLTVIGTPCSGPSRPPSATAWSAASAAVARLVAEHAHDGVERAVDRSMRPSMRIEHLTARRLAVADRRRQLDRAHCPQFAHVVRSIDRAQPRTPCTYRSDHPADAVASACASLARRAAAHAARRRRAGGRRRRRRGRGRAIVSWWRVAAGARRQPRAAGRRQLRQRLQRRRARHRRRPGRPGAARRLRAGPAGRGEAGGVRRVRRRRRRRAGAGRRPRRGGCSPSVRRRSPPRGSTPAARARTATSGSARCSCSCSSASSPPSARRTWPSSGSPALSVVMGCARRVRWPAPCSSSTTCATSRRHGRRQADAGRAARRRRDPVALRRPARRGVRAASWSPRSWRPWVAARRSLAAAARRRRRAGRARRRPGPALIAVLGGDRPAAAGLRRAWPPLGLRAQRLSRADASSVDDEGVRPLEVDACGRRPRRLPASASGMPAAMRSADARRTWRRGRRRRRARASSARRAGPTAGPGCRCRPGAGSRQPAAVLRRRSSSPGSGRRGEQRLGQPPAEERSTPSRSIVAGQRVVVATPRGRARSSSSMPGRGADQHQALDEVGTRRGPGAGTAARPSSSRRTSPARRRRRAGRRRGTGPPRTSAEPPWPGASTATTSWSRGERGGDGVPRPSGLGEPVDEDEPVARPR